MDPIYNHFIDNFRETVSRQDFDERRIGAELKFPLVRPDGSAVDYDMIHRLWDFLQKRGWNPMLDGPDGKVVGATKPGEQNETLASCETGYCKTEFSLAHVGSLLELQESIEELRTELLNFAERENVRFLCHGIHPRTPPGEELLMKKGRTSVWDTVFGSNEHIPPERGDDFHLFTINSASHVHLSVNEAEAVKAVNVFNGFAPAQIALTAHSSVWQGEVDDGHRCVAEKFWDWWMEDANRVGMPHKPFEDIEDYVHTIADMPPVYVKREHGPVVLTDYDSFSDYYAEEEAVGYDVDGNAVAVVPHEADIDLHNSCYWFNARISRHYTLENRTNDQQPQDALPAIAALSLGLLNSLEEAEELVMAHDWDDLRETRHHACKEGIKNGSAPVDLEHLAGSMLEVARRGLKQRGMGEEKFLKPLETRLEARTCPADEAAEIVEDGGIESLVENRALRPE